MIDGKSNDNAPVINDNKEGFSPRIQSEPVDPEKAADFQINNGVLKKYSGSDEVLSIPEGVREIGGSACYKNENLKKIIIPSDVKKINCDYYYDGSFRDCPKLSEVIIAEGVTDIGSGTFANCEKLHSVSLPISLLSISERVFSNCTHLENIKIPPYIKFIGNEAFYNCRSLKEIEIPFGVISLGNRTFGDCKKLTSLFIPSSITEISLDTFSGCPNLEINIDEKTRIEKLNFAYTYSEYKTLLQTEIVKSILHKTKITGIRSYKVEAAIEFILNSDQYPADLTAGYLKFCISNRQQILNNAGEKDKEKIIAYFDELDKASGFTSGKKKLNDNEKVLLLEKMADEGTFAEFREVFEEYKPFEFYPRVLEKACISGDPEKVKLLVESGASFSSPYKNIFKDRYISRFNYEIIDVHYPKKGKKIIWHPDLVKIISSPKSSAENVVNILQILKRQDLVNPQAIFLASILARNEEVSQKLYENRYRLNPDELDNYFRSHERFYHDFPVNSEKAIQKIAQDFKRYGVDFYSLSLSSYYLGDAGSAFFKPELLNEYLKYNGGNFPFSVDEIFSESIRLNKIKTIDFLIESGQIVPYAEKYIDGEKFNKWHSKGGEKLVSIVDHSTPRILDLMLRKAHWPVTDALFSRMYEYAVKYKSSAIQKWLEDNKTELFKRKETYENPTVNESNCKIEELDYGVYEIVSYNGTDADVIIPSHISDKVINNFKKAAFRNKKFKSVIIEEGITFISEQSFSQCKNLESVRIPESVLRIGKDAFRGCTKLQRIDIPSSVRSIDSGAFCECSNLSEVNIMPGTKIIGENAFSDCKNLQQINIPESVIYIGREAFLNCSQLTNITFHEGLQHVCTRVFHGCDSLSDIQLPKSLKLIDEQAFPNNLVPDNTLSEQNHQIDERILLKLEKIKKKLEDEEYFQSYSYDKIPGELYLNFEAKGTRYNDVDKNISQLKPGDTIQIIRDPENKYNSNNFRLSTIDGKDAGNMPAKLCNALAPFYDKDEIVLEYPTVVSVNSYGIDLQIEVYCVPKVKDADISKIEADESEQAVGEDYFTYSDPDKKTILHYYGRVKNLQIPNEVKKISTAVFRNRPELESVILPEGLTEIDACAFENCDNLSSINLPDSLTTIGESAFKNCRSLKSIILPRGIKKINKNAFEGCINLQINGSKFVIINDVLINYIGDDVDVEIPEGIIAIEEEAFSNCSDLSNISIPNSMLYIGRRAFKDCINLENITIPDSVEVIDYYAFQNCKKLLNVTIPSSVSVLCPSIFDGCLRSKLKLHVYKDSAAMVYAKNNDLKCKMIKTDANIQPLMPEEITRQNIIVKLIEVKNNLSDWSSDPHYDVLFDYRKKELIIPFEAKGTLYEGRSENIEFVKAGDPIQVVRDPGNKYNSKNFRLMTEDAKDVGNIPEDICIRLAPLYDSGNLKIDAKASYVEPLSKRGPRCRKSILFVEICCAPNTHDKQDEDIFAISTPKDVDENGIPDDVIELSSTDLLDTEEQETNKQTAEAIHVPEIFSPKNEIQDKKEQAVYVIPAPKIVSSVNKEQIENSVSNNKTKRKQSNNPDNTGQSQSDNPDKTQEKSFSSLLMSSVLDSIQDCGNRNLTQNDIYDSPSGIDENHPAKSKPSEQKQVVVKRKITDPKLSEAIEKVFEKLEELYPEHKVFALDNIDKKLRADITELFPKAGYQSDKEMLAAYDFEFISGDEVKQIRNQVIYTPGAEPDLIKIKIENMLHRLNEAYPDHIIPDTLAKNHKSLSGTVSGLYQWLGYSDAVMMLEAYGYTYTPASTGRSVKNNYDEIINALITKYRNSEKPESMVALYRDNPELKGPLKSLQNNQYSILGMTLSVYLKKVGVIASDLDPSQFSERVVLKNSGSGNPVNPSEKDNPPKSSQNIPSSDIDKPDEKKMSIDDDIAADEANVQDEVDQDNLKTEAAGLPDGFAAAMEDPMYVAVIDGKTADTEFTENASDSEEKITPENNDFGDQVISGDLDANINNHSKFLKTDSSTEQPLPEGNRAVLSDQKAAWIQYQAYEAVSGGRAPAYFFFDLRNEITLGNYNWQSEEFLYFYMKYFPGISINQLWQWRAQAVSRLTDTNTCNMQYQIIMQDSFEHRYVMIAYAWFERAVNLDPVTRTQSIFNACRTFFYPQEQQELWNRLNYESNS